MSDSPQQNCVMESSLNQDKGLIKLLPEKILPEKIATLEN
jgi:hypothetical protein